MKARFSILLCLVLAGCINGTGGDGTLYSKVGLGPKEIILTEVHSIGVLSNASKLKSGSVYFDPKICREAASISGRLRVNVEVDAGGRIRRAIVERPELGDALRARVEREAEKKILGRGLLDGAYSPYRCILEVDCVSARASIAEEPPNPESCDRPERSGAANTTHVEQARST